MDDLGVYNPSSGEWNIRGSSGLRLFLSDLENSGDRVTVPADYDGDGVTDLASWHPSSGTWVIFSSGDNFGTVTRDLRVLSPHARRASSGLGSTISIFTLSTGR